jgi:hypothetical protein
LSEFNKTTEQLDWNLLATHSDGKDAVNRVVNDDRHTGTSGYAYRLDRVACSRP